MSSSDKPADKPGKKRSKKKYIAPLLIIFGNLRTVSAGYQANS